MVGLKDKKKGQFTDSFIKGLKAGEKQYELIEDSGERGFGRLGVRVNTSGQKVFFFRYSLDGKFRFITIGVYGESAGSLKAARDRAQELGYLVKSGKDPKALIEQQKANEVQLSIDAKKVGTIKQLFEAYTNNMQKKGRRTYKVVLSELEKEVYPIIPPDTKAKDVTKSQIKTIIGNMITRGAPIQSNRVSAYLSAAFSYAIAHDNNPVRDGDNDDAPLFDIVTNIVKDIPKVDENIGERELTESELGFFLLNFQNTKKVGILPVLLVKLMILMGGQRRYEIANSKWGAVDWTNRVFLTTAELSKNGKATVTPLCDSSVEVLMAIKNITYPNLPKAEAEECYIFCQRNRPDLPIGRFTLNTAIRRFIEEFGWKNSFSVRDLRRTCKSLGGFVGLSKEVRDRIQNHALHDVSSKHYDRYNYLNEKRIALYEWEKYLITLLERVRQAPPAE